jgi:hypothetical protein
MFRRARDAADQVAHLLEIETALDFALDHLADQGGLAAFCGEGAASQRVTLSFRQADSEGAFQPEKLTGCKTDCKTNQRSEVRGRGRKSEVSRLRANRGSGEPRRQKRKVNGEK